MCWGRNRGLDLVEGVYERSANGEPVSLWRNHHLKFAAYWGDGGIRTPNRRSLRATIRLKNAATRA